MKNLLYIFSIAAVLLGIANGDAQPLKLWYNKPAEKWTDALPIGNGRLGAMIYGGVNSDHIQFNEQTLWTGEPRQYQRAGAASYLPEIRKLLFEGKQAQAEALAEKRFMGTKDDELTYSADSLKWVNMMLAFYLPQDPTYHFFDTWQSITLPTEQGWEKAPGLDGVDGAIWFQTTFTLPKEWLGKDLTLSLGRIRDVDVTYINSERIGTTNGSGYRKYFIPAANLHVGENQILVQVLNFNDKGGFTSSAKELMIYPVGTDAANLSTAVKLSGQWKYWIQNSAPPAYPAYQASYQPFGDLYLNFKTDGEVTGYKRSLDLKTALANVSYTNNGVHFSREYFASAPDKTIAIHLSADKAGQINFDALLNTPHKLSSVHQVDSKTLRLNLQVTHGVLKGAACLYATVKSGTVTIKDSKLRIANADDVTLYLTAATNFKTYNDVSGDPDAICKLRLQMLKAKTFGQVKQAHTAEYQHCFNTFSLNLGTGKNEALPTDDRIKNYSTADDPALLTLYVQYARYLLISCSRPDNLLPANLQGIWNDQMVPPWGSKFTTNINLQMNYWPAEELNLSACAKPLFTMIGSLAKTGSVTARIHYDSPGWILHHNTDIWLGTAPINASNHGIWEGGAAWLSRHLWEHYLYTQDKAFLLKYYPELKGAAEFFVHSLVKDPQTGYLISSPSNSPEHGGLVAGPTMDRQIIRDLFKNCIAASEVLNTDAAFRKILQEKYPQIAPNKIGKYGQLQEWMEDKDDTADTHRHVSHLWGVFPGTDITWDSPQLMHAAEKSFQYRGDDGTGWSLAWKVNLMARFKQGDHAMLLMNKLLSVAENGSAKERGGVYHNLFDAHPPFQIDGNFGGAAGIAEMLLQSQQGYIDLLPALPTALPNGEINGICARGGFVLNIKWQKGKLQQVEVISKTGNDCDLRYGDKNHRFKTVKGKTYVFNGDLKAA